MDQKTRRAIVWTVVIAILLISLIVQAMKERKNEQLPPVQPPNAPLPEERDQQPGPAPAPPSRPADSSIHVAMGNPSEATDDPANPDNFLMRKPYFALSYNNATGTPNWVSWCLRDSDLGSASRAEFHPDTTLPSGFRRITPHDYSGSGFDRGHMCPHGDRTSSPEAAKATFVMTNIVPQAPHLNQRAWNDCEDYCRGLVKGKSRVLYIVAGPQGQGGEGTNGRSDTIAGGKVTVPAKCWKVVLAVENGTGGADDVPKVTAASRVIAVIMPNDQSVGHGWAKFRTSVKEVETLKGYKFFDRLPSIVTDALKAKVDAEHIPPVRHPRTGE